MAVKIGVGLLGCGTVGSAVLRLLAENREEISQRSGCEYEVVKVAVRDGGRPREAPIPDGTLTTDAQAVVRDPEVQVVVEVMGGVEPARSLILDALAEGKSVVTANKELLASHGAELFEAASKGKTDLLFEAAVAGGIPLIRPLRESLSGERITRILGIVNGTTNYILTRMSEDGMSFAEALTDATELGYAEADPDADLEGFDAAAKCAILASLAFGAPVVASDVYREGIAGVSNEDIGFAARLGYDVKLLAVAELEDGQIAVRVHPAMIPLDHPLASVREAFNAVFVEGPNIGQLMFYGRGAGGEPTAVAVVGDLVDAGINISRDSSGFVSPFHAERAVRPMEAMETQYYLLLDVVDRPGVLAKLASAFGDNGVSIKSVWQEGTGDDALIVIITHRANEGSVQATVRDLRALGVVLQVRSVMRVAGEE
ncbi:MAG: homoserine dehydrogenase [Actinomycetota bacterium]